MKQPPEQRAANGSRGPPQDLIEARTTGTGEPVIVLLSNSEDPHVTPVASELDRRGVEHVRLDTDTVWSEVAVDLSGCATAVTETWLTGGLGVSGVPVELSHVSTIWNRRPGTPAVSPAIGDCEARRFAEAEWGVALHGVLRSTSASWMSHPDRVRAASFKPAQLPAAARHGFQLPATCITNNMETARRFIASVGDEAIAKLVSPGPPSSTGSEPYNVLAQRITRRDLDDQSVKACPMILQEVVPKVVELRVTVVGREVFACEIDSQSVPAACTDWRRVLPQEIPHRPVRLDPTLEHLCRTFAQRLGLSFAAIDLIRTPDGEFVFLELNPNGQWLWIEDLTGLPIAQAIAAWLVAPTV